MAELDNERLQSLRPDVEQSRVAPDGSTQHLLIWGALGAWMIVDRELKELLAEFDGRRSVTQVLRAHARRQGRHPRDVHTEALPVLDDLVRRGILSTSGRVRPPEPDPVRLANVTLNLTNRCNLHCRWCYNERRELVELPIDTLLDALEASKGLLSEDASFIVLGGEPLLEPLRLLRAIERAEGLFQPPTLFSTNGTLLTDKVIHELTRRRVQVQVSLDGSRAERHDGVRGLGVFASAVSGIRRLTQAGVYTILSLVYTRESAQDLEGFLDLAVELGANEARFIPLRAIGKGREHAPLLPDQLATFEHLLGVLARRPELARLLVRDYFSILVTQLAIGAPRLNCGLGRSVVFLDPDGSVYPCPNHVSPAFLVGNLREQSLEELMVTAPVLRDVRESRHVHAYSRCRSCAFRCWCAGDCRGEVLALRGNWRDPSPHCAELREVYCRILWLLASGRCPIGVQRRRPSPCGA